MTKPIIIVDVRRQIKKIKYNSKLEKWIFLSFLYFIEWLLIWFLIII